MVAAGWRYRYVGPAVAAALDRARIVRPDGFTAAVVFRRCLRCQERNVIRDDDFTCAVCEAQLPAAWNVADGSR